MNTNKLTFFIKKCTPTFIAFALVAILLTACGQSSEQAAPAPTPTEMPPSGETAPVVSAAKAALAEKLNISEDSIQLVTVQPVQWPDSCLGVQQPGIMCAMHVVDGYRVTLSANDQTYEVRSNLDGSQTVLSPDPASMPKGNANE